MSLIIIHGNGLTAISKKISEIKAKFDPLSIQQFSAKQIDFDQAVIQSATGGLFSEKKLVILEDFDAVDLDQLSDDAGTTIVIKFSKNLPINSALLKQSLGLKAQILSFTEAEETNIFPFLDNLAGKNPQAVQQLGNHLGEWGGQYVLTMIFYLLRRMVQSPKKLPSFVQQKIVKQKQNFPIERITELYKAGLETDFKIKSGLMEEKMGLTLLVNEILTS